MACPTNTPLSRKFGIKEDAAVGLVDAPAGFRSLLTPLPRGVTLASDEDMDLDVIVWFLRDAGSLRERFGEMTDRLTTAGGLWVCWPKKTSGVVTDLSENVMREVGLAAGLVDNKVCAIDATWSGLRFVRRLRDRR